MANGYNQYIGMRYVPIVDGAWSATKAYEPLVVVTYNGNSYISKTFVPVGTIPTNEEYWILSANYNAQVEQYRQEVREYQSIVENFDTDISELETTVETHSTQISKLTSDLEAIGHDTFVEGTANISSSEINAMVIVCSAIVSPGKWMVVSHLDATSSGSGVMVNRTAIGDKAYTVRTTEGGGGGCCNVVCYEVEAETTVTLSGVVSHATTLRGKIDLVRL